MDTFVARFLQPTPLVVAVVAALSVLAIAVALAVALASGVDLISIANADTSPFRWV